MTAISANGITIEYEETGNRTDPVVILIRGLGTQLIDWPVALLDGLAGEGFRVIVHDNRDVGLSTKFDKAGAPDLADAVQKAAAGLPTGAAYTLDDMALDVVGLMDALGIAGAHIMGISMGGMIAQILAAVHHKRVRSLTSIMSSSGNPDLPQAAPGVMKAMMAAPEDPNDREAVIRLGTETLKIIGSPGFPETEESRRAAYTARFERSYYPVGVARQMQAILLHGSRIDLLKTISVPTLVIHGKDDPLVPVAAGRDTAAKIPNSDLKIIDGMGHSIPMPLVPQFVTLIAQHARKAQEAADKS